MAWSNTDDLDLRLIEPNGGIVYYGNKGLKSNSGAILDVDANGSSGMMENPVENIYWTNLPTQVGNYQVVVNQYSKRGTSNQGYDLEVEFKGETYSFSVKDNGATGSNNNILTFNYSKTGEFTIVRGDAQSGGSYKSNEKWGVKTGVFHQISALTLSPNFWSGEFGNKHFMFFIKDCVSDEVARGFYNEFLHNDLSKDRKVFEVLGSKIQVEKTKNELSGLGFSDTIRNELIIEVDSTFKRLLRIKF